MHRADLTRSTDAPAARAVVPAPRSEGATDTLLQQLIYATGATEVMAWGSAAVSKMPAIAAALRDNGSGRVIGCEPDTAQALRVAMALDKAGLSRYAEVLQGGIHAVLRSTPGPIDLLVLGCPGEEFLPVLRAVEPRLLPGAGVVAFAGHDSPPHPAELLARYLSFDNGYVSLSLPFDGGLELSVRAV